jgi:DNA recombination protein RmuC
VSALLPLIAGALLLGLGYWLGRRGSDGLLERAIRAEEQAEGARRQLAEDQARIDKLKAEFGELAGRLLDEKSGKLREEAGRQFEGVVGPLKQNLEDLKALTDRIHKDDYSQRAGLEATIKALAETHQSFVSEARGLSPSLKGNVKGQGRWGELVLEKVLEAAGLRAGQEYQLQGKGLELKAPDGSAQRPDAIVLLPEGKHLVVDAKTSLDGYDAWLKAADEAGREQAASQQALALRKQVKELSEKSYQSNEKLGSPEFTIMFVPSEPALGIALQREPGLFEQAWEKRVVVVGPNTLFGTLKVVAQLWGQERRNKNAEEIARRGGLLYDKLVGFIEDMGKAKSAMKTALDAQDAAHQKLVEGRGNVIAQAEELKHLGAKASKALPANWVEKAGTEA